MLLLLLLLSALLFRFRYRYPFFHMFFFSFFFFLNKLFLTCDYVALSLDLAGNAMATYLKRMNLRENKRTVLFRIFFLNLCKCSGLYSVVLFSCVVVIILIFF